MNPPSPSAESRHPSLKHKLASGGLAVGAVLSTGSVEIAAHAARLGFDFLWIEVEHSPITLESLRSIVLATRGTPAVPVARVPANELWQAKRVLDAGVLGVVFPFTQTPTLAAQAVAACRYPPHGLRGSGAGLAQLRWPAPEGYYDFADREVLVVAMIEDVHGVDQVESIAATPGLDVLFVGPSDLSFSLGLRGRQDDPRLQAAIDKVVQAARRHGKFLGRPAVTAAERERFAAEGFQFFHACTELDLMTSGARDLLGSRFTDPCAGGPAAI